MSRPYKVVPRDLATHYISGWSTSDPQHLRDQKPPSHQPTVPIAQAPYSWVAVWDEDPPAAAPAPKDLKEALGSGRKPDTSHMRTPTEVYCARNGEYGDDKYQRSNYLRPAGGIAAEFRRHRTYLRAVRSHAGLILDAMERHQAMDPELTDEAGMIAAVRDPDLDTDGRFPASGLPHHGGIVASINMAITQAVEYGLLPKDPGQPWKEKK
jgi:hypothetical protein